MQPAPEDIGGYEVVCYTLLDERHEPTGRAAHSVGGADSDAPAGLAICLDDGSNAYHLFYCDADWDPVTDSWHHTLDDAKNQAEREFAGVEDTWETPG